jgi:autotransporter-associated beta strand protein
MAPGLALAQNGTWITSTGGSWPTQSNWASNNIADGSGNTALFSGDVPLATGWDITLDGNRTIGNLTFVDTVTSSSNGSWRVNPGSSGTLTLSVSTGTSTITTTNIAAAISTVIAGSGGLIKAGNGTLFLSGANTYSGTTTANVGTLEVVSADALGLTGAGNGTIVASGARVRIGNNITTNEDFRIAGAGSSGVINFGSSISGSNVSNAYISGQVTLTGNSRIDVATNSTGGFDRGVQAGHSIDLVSFTGTFAGGGTLYVKSPIVGASGGSLAFNGSGTVYLTGANTYTGTTGFGTAVSTMYLGDGSTGGSLSASSAITITNANATFGVFQSDTVIQGTDFSGSAITGPGKFTQAGTGTTVFTAANSYAGATSVNAGALQLGDAGTTGGLSTSSAIAIASGANLRVNRTNAVTQGTDFSTAAITGDGGFTQAGSGTTTLNAANSYAGTTLVNAGKLLINGDQSSATGAVTVAAGATLGGSGTVGGNTTITGIHSPGNSPGIQTFNGNLTYEAGAVVNWELIANSTGSPGTNFDQIVLPTTGNLTFNGSTTLALSFNGAGSAVDWSNTFWNVNRSWTVYDLSFGAVSNAGSLVIGGSLLDSLGNSLSPTGRGYFNTSVSGQDVILNFVAVPEPSTIMLLSGLAVGGFLLRRRRA